MLYNAFVSYSHAADGKLGPALQSALHRFARRWYQLRALRVFRDDTNLSFSPALWMSIEKALSESEFLILLASPTAAKSKWVQREVDFWLSQKSPEHLLLVVTDGQVAWDDAAGDFDWRITDCLPGSLKGAFAGEPKFVDFRWARSGEGLALNNPVFLDNIADLAANLHGKDKDALVGEDIRQHRKVRRLAWSGVITLTLLTVLSVSAGLFAWMQKNQAERQQQIALGRSLAFEAQLLRDDRAGQLPQTVLLAIESYRRFPSPDAYRTLRSGLALLPSYEKDSGLADAMRLAKLPALPSRPLVEGTCANASRTAIGYSADGERVASVVEDGTTVEVRPASGGDVVYRSQSHKGCVYRGR